MIAAADPLVAAAAELLRSCRTKRLKLATAESCTGGLIAAVLTEVPGSSEVFERGFVTYSNLAKSEALGVPAELIEAHGAVSRQVAEAMAQGALRHSAADIAVAATGVAGPGGGTAQKPVGLVHLAAARRGGSLVHRMLQAGDVGRNAVRRAAVAESFELIAALLSDPAGRSPPPG